MFQSFEIQVSNMSTLNILQNTSFPLLVRFFSCALQLRVLPFNCLVSELSLKRGVPYHITLPRCILIQTTQAAEYRSLVSHTGVSVPSARAHLPELTSNWVCGSSLIYTRRTDHRMIGPYILWMRLHEELFE